MSILINNKLKSFQSEKNEGLESLKTSITDQIKLTEEEISRLKTKISSIDDELDELVRDGGSSATSRSEKSQNKRKHRL